MASENKPTLLAVGDAVAPTGFARVTHNILAPLAPRYDLHQLAVNYFGDPHQTPWKLYPASIGGDRPGTRRLPGLFDQLQPDLLFIVTNLPSLQGYLAALGERAEKVPIVAYCPVEAEPIPPERPPALRNINCLVFYTDFAKREFEKAVEKSGDKSCREAFTDVRVIPHGVNTAEFYPLEADDPDRQAVKTRIKSELYDGDQEHIDSFVVLNANRNQPRKRIDLTIRGFAEFARDKDRYVKLHLHMGTRDVGWQVIDLCRRFGIYERLVMTNRSSTLPSVQVEELNRIYNAADVGINTASSEGWGLVSFEHAATGAAQIVPRHASCADLWSGTAEMVAPSLTITDPGSMTDQHLVSPGAVAAALERLYTDLKHRQTVAERCHQYATQPELQWPNLAARWGKLFEEMLTNSA